MTKILGIDTSNYTTSIAIVEDGKCILDIRKILTTKSGVKGLRQSEALFQHINNLPELLSNDLVRSLDGVCVSTKPRPVENSYMPVFRAGENFARAICSTGGIKLFLSTHQEGHIEAALSSVDFNYNKFICIHLSGGTTEILLVEREDTYKLDIIGKTLDISAGQFIDRAGVAMGLNFPCGKQLDEMALFGDSSKLNIPYCVKGFNVNFSGQETKCLKYIKEGNNSKDISAGVMKCISQSLVKIIKNINSSYNLPVLITGGVGSSKYLKTYIETRLSNVVFSNPIYASDNAVGIAYIGYGRLRRI
jgi:N6-L-threonylcarbamoyladenine synthase